MEDVDSDRYRAPALDKGLDILELLSGVDGGLTQAEISKHLGRSPNEFYRMLDRLVRRGYVARLDGDRFSLTLKLFGLAQFHAPARRLASFATPLMRELSEVSCQACQLAVFDTGSGHVLLAFRPDEERRMMIAEHLRSSERSEQPAEFFDRLDQVRGRGYELMASLQTAGVYNLSAPVLAPNGRAIAAITVPYITLINMPAAPDMTRTISLLLDTAKRLSQIAGSDIGGASNGTAA